MSESLVLSVPDYHEPIHSSSLPERDLVVAVKNVRKSFGKGLEKVDALNNVSVSINAGEIVGVLGPNGAGKTTLISILEGFIVPDSGVVTVFDKEPASQFRLSNMKDRLGVSMQNSVLPPLLTITELLALKSALHFNPKDIDTLIDAMALTGKKNAQFKNLSGGQQQRVVIAMALIGNPELMFLDEPTSQLDPQARRAVWELLLEQKKSNGCAILVTTHQMEEAQRLCDRVLIIDHGKIIASGVPKQLIREHCPEQTLEFSIAADTNFDLFPNAEISAVREDGLVNVKVEGENIEEAITELMLRARKNMWRIEDLRINEKDLEDVFIKLTGRGIRQ